MKIKIIEADHIGDGVLSLADCGFQIGDVVVVSCEYKDGGLSVKAIRNTELVSLGDDIGLNEGEYEVIEE